MGETTGRGFSILSRIELERLSPTRIASPFHQAPQRHFACSAGTRRVSERTPIDPTNPAFADSRKPLAREFMYNGHHLFVIANHFNSKGGDQPLFGRFQPPAFSSQVQRTQQATLVNSFVKGIIALDAKFGMPVAMIGDAVLRAIRGVTDEV
jgi:hypothetical protein